MILKLGPPQLTKLIAKASNNHLGFERARQWRRAAQASLELYGEEPALAVEDRAEEVRTEVRLLRSTLAELERHERARESAYRRVDPRQLARSLPGIATVVAPAVVAIMARPGRFPTAAHFLSFTGLAPKASETGETDRKGQPMSKAGPRLLRAMLVRAADTARKLDPQLARIYFEQMTERGAHHQKALCVVAAHLATRLWAVMTSGQPYQLRDCQGRPASPEQAKAEIAHQWTVTDSIRRRRRSKKRGKVPHRVLAGHVNHGGAPGATQTRRPSPPPMVLAGHD